MSQVMAVADDEIAPEEAIRRARLTKKRKSRAINVYLKPGVREDELLSAIWDAHAEGGRPQDVYRRMLLEGLKRMIENGDMSLSVMKDPRVVQYLDVLGDLDRDRRQPFVVVAPHQAPGVATAAPAYAPPLAAVADAALAARPEVKPAPPKKAKKGLDPNLM